MRFLVVTTNKHLAPREIGLVLMQAMKDWLDRYASKMEQVWAFAGTQGGGGILNVESAEELDQIMTEFPYGPFSNVEIYPLTELRASLDRAKAVMESMAPPQG